MLGGSSVNDWLTRALYTVDLLELEGLHAEAADVAERLMPLAEGAEDMGRCGGCHVTNYYGGAGSLGCLERPWPDVPVRFGG